MVIAGGRKHFNNREGDFALLCATGGEDLFIVTENVFNCSLLTISVHCQNIYIVVGTG